MSEILGGLKHTGDIGAHVYMLTLNLYRYYLGKHPGDRLLSMNDYKKA